EALAARLERGFERAKNLFRLRGIVGRQIANVDVDADEARFRPGMNGDVRLGEQDRSSHALRLELEKTLTDNGEAGIARRPDAQLAQWIGFCVYRASARRRR